MPSRKRICDLSVRQRSRRRRQQLAIDLGEDNDTYSNDLLEKSTHLGSSSPSSQESDKINIMQVNQMEIENPHNFSGFSLPHDSAHRNGEDDNATVLLDDKPSRLPDMIPSENDISVANNRSLQAESSPSDLNSPMDTNSTRSRTVPKSAGDEEFSLSSELAKWAIQFYVPQVSLNHLLRVLRNAGQQELPMDSRTLLNTPRTSNTNDLTQGSYVHYGLENSLKYQLANRTTSLLESEILIDINVNGLPLSKSSQSSLWPILGKIVHRGFHMPFVIGAYHYKSKPSSVHEFLGPFVEEYTRLHTEGFYYEGTKYTTTIRAVICDSPARCFVTFTKQYNGYFGCPKYTTESTYLRFVTFLELDAPLRTDEDFKYRRQEKHHTGTSPFGTALLKMVSQFPLDYMHVILLGIVKKLILLWLTRKGILSASARVRLSAILLSLAKWMPREFRKKPRGINEVRMWKATEFRLFLLYLGPTVLRNVLPDTLSRHFNSLSCAIQILCDPDDCIRNNDTAKDLLIWFVSKFVTLYGAEEMVSNVHNLIHITEDVKLYGSLDSFSAFPFENFMQKLKRFLRSPVNPLQQLHRRLAEMMGHIQPFEECQEGPVLLKSIAGNLPNGCNRPHSAIRFPRFYLSIKRPDNCCYTKDGAIVVIEHISYRNAEPVILGRKLRQLSGMPLYPFDSRIMDMYNSVQRWVPSG